MSSEEKAVEIAFEFAKRFGKVSPHPKGARQRAPEEFTISFNVMMDPINDTPEGADFVKDPFEVVLQVRQTEVVDFEIVGLHFS